jgi:hypothetical protein
MFRSPGLGVIRPPQLGEPLEEAREIELHLKVWHVKHPGTRVELVDRQPTGPPASRLGGD